MSGIEKLMAFLDGSPSCFHAVANLARRLEEAGYTPLSEAEDWQLLPGGKYYLTRNQSALIAFRVPQSKPQGFMLSASHSDRPCFKIKENPELETAGVYLRLAVERYGGMLMAPWLDRPLSAAGRVLVETAEGIRSCLVDLDRDLCMIPHVAIHMNRKANEGYSYNPAVDLIPLLGSLEARGDLGVEIPFVEVPSIQKFLINKCRLLGKRVITATEMLESMIHNPRPTRAEISDVANAVYDGSSAVMLSGETAAGKYPVAAVKNMAEIAEYTEKHISYIHRFHTTDFKILNTLDAVSHATCAMAIDVGAKCIVVSSVTGRTARMVSRFRCPTDIVGMTTTERAWRKLALSWGVTPVLSEEFTSMDVMFYHALNQAKRVCHLQKGDNVVLTGGQINGQPGNTNTIKVETVK